MSFINPSQHKKVKRLAILAPLFFLANLLTLSLPLAAEVTVIKSKDIEPYNLSLEALKQAIKITIREENMEGSLKKGLRIIGGLKSEKPDLILSYGAEAAYVAGQNVKDIPVVFSMVSNPEKYNIIGKNITGVKLNISLESQVRVLREVMPGIKKVGVIYSTRKIEEGLERVRPVMEKMGLRLVAEEVRSAKEIPSKTEDLVSRVDCLWLLFDPLVTSSPRIVRDIILFQTLRKRIPVVGFNKWSVTAGALFYIHSKYEDIGQQTAAIIKRIIDGDKPSDIPIEGPKKVRVFFNRKVMERVKTKVTLFVPDYAYIWSGE